jgi:hypothetical protein
MNYEQYLESGEKPVGKASPGWKQFPLAFDPHDELLDVVADYSVIDDFMANEDMEDFREDFGKRFPAYDILAICDVGHAQKQDPDFPFDSYAEFFFVVDKSSDGMPVLLWTGEESFQPFSDSFEEFWSSLVDWHAQK